MAPHAPPTGEKGKDGKSDTLHTLIAPSVTVGNRSTPDAPNGQEK
jgi:hypothetical protein